MRKTLLICLVTIPSLLGCKQQPSRGKQAQQPFVFQQQQVCNDKNNYCGKRQTSKLVSSNSQGKTYVCQPTLYGVGSSATVLCGCETGRIINAALEGSCKIEPIDQSRFNCASNQIVRSGPQDPNGVATCQCRFTCQ